MSEPTYRSIPPLAAYLDRIGAEELNFRRFIVREYAGRSGYYTERCLIKINSDGTIHCAKKEYEPTQQEADAIKSALALANFPLAINARNADLLRQDLGQTARLFEFWDRTTSELAMVQQRVDFPNGTKAYLPWTFFSDGQWRRMEPDTDLPFWKPQQPRLMPRIMVHEGAKAAAFVDDLVNSPARRQELAAHPWCDELIRYEHWGLIGGALAPHRAKYTELHRENPREVVYVCDNDFEGKSVIQNFSKYYRKPLKGVIFDSDFPEHWDMADKIPDKLFHGNHYHGPLLHQLMLFATWATERIPNPAGRGAAISVLTNEFKQEWVHCVTPEAYIHVDWPNRILTANEFNDLVAPFSDSTNTALLLQRDQTAKRMQLSYTPAREKGTYHDDTSGLTGGFINTHTASEIKAIKGDPTPWLQFMEHLCPDVRDRTEVLRWCATLIARPEVRMHYGILAISETQGVGKGTLGEKILAPLVGRVNVSFPSESDIVDSNFNYWLSHKRLAIVHEIYAGNSSRPYNKLKSAITDQRITVSRKYMANYEIDNWIHVFACSNSTRALKLSADDRRWFVPRIVEARRTTQYWSDLNVWLELEGGLGIIKHWAHEWLKQNEPVRTGDPAPDSTLKRDVIEEGLSPGQELVLRALTRIKDQLKDIKDLNLIQDQRKIERIEAIKREWEAKHFLHGNNVILLDKTLVELIKEQIYEGRQNDRLERPLTVRKIAKMCGWHISEQRASVPHWGYQNYGARIICSSGELAKLTPMELLRTHHSIRPLDLDQLREPL